MKTYLDDAMIHNGVDGPAACTGVRGREGSCPHSRVTLGGRVDHHQPSVGGQPYACCGVIATEYGYPARCTGLAARRSGEEGAHLCLGKEEEDVGEYVEEEEGDKEGA